MLTLQSFKSQSVCLLMFEVKWDNLSDVILLTSQGVSFSEVQEGLNQPQRKLGHIWVNRWLQSGNYVI